MPAPATIREYKSRTPIHGDDWTIREVNGWYELIVWNDNGVEIRTEIPDDELVSAMETCISRLQREGPEGTND